MQEWLLPLDSCLHYLLLANLKHKTFDTKLIFHSYSDTLILFGMVILHFFASQDGMPPTKIIAFPCLSQENKSEKL